jgi:hypothetical protein
MLLLGIRALLHCTGGHVGKNRRSRPGPQQWFCQNSIETHFSDCSCAPATEPVS